MGVTPATVCTASKGAARRRLGGLLGMGKKFSGKSSCTILEPHDDFRQSQPRLLFPEEIKVPIAVEVSNSEPASSGLGRVNRESGNFMRTTEMDLYAWLPARAIKGQGITDTIVIEVYQSGRRVRLELRDNRGNTFFMLCPGRRAYVGNGNGDHQKEYFKSAWKKSSPHTSDHISDMDY